LDSANAAASMPWVAIAATGTWLRGETTATCAKNRPSRAIA